MTVLPIKLITDTDLPLFGESLLNLGKLARADFSVPSAVGVSAPEIVLQTVLTHVEGITKDIFDQRLVIIKKEVFHISIPEDLYRELGRQPLFYFEDQLYKNKVKLWQAMLERWLEEIKRFLWNNGFSEGVNLSLSPLVVIFLKEKSFPATAFYDPALQDVVVKCEKALPAPIANQIDRLVTAANKKLFLPQNYHLLIGARNVYLTGLTPFTQSLPASEVPQVFIPKTAQKEVAKSAVKLFLNLSSGFALATKVDGILIEGEKLNNFDEAVFKLAEASLSLPKCPVIYKMPETGFGGVRGALYLIHQKSLLDEVGKIILFVRNKKNICNVELAIPLTRSSEELLQLKRELAAREITRKGSLKIWWEAAIPENLINLDDYLQAGIDGVILNLDSLQRWLGGFEVTEMEHYRKQIMALEKFIGPALKLLHKEKIPVLVKGELAAYSDVLNWLLEQGVWGVVANSVHEAEELPDYLNWIEKRLIGNKLKAVE